MIKAKHGHLPMACAVVLFLLLFAANCQQQGEKGESEQEGKSAAIMQIVEEAWNQGNLDILDEYYAADTVHHRPPFPDFEGLDEYKNYISGTRSAYPDLHFMVDEIIMDGDSAAVRITFQGTHTMESWTIPGPATGKSVTIPVFIVIHWSEGKIVEEWENTDWLGLMQQMGYTLMPPSPPTTIKK
jgi:predicted ester cyclase